ncbi:MAG: DEAD/DEAH box helicase [Prevotellaceae bacterium]|jgi:superfamily II DNA or RNA helicase|nr:DEAD/DEAH box helicase [Prevotellaceae bacterium]
MQPNQKQFYDSLEGVDKTIVQIAIFCASDIDIDTLTRYVFLFTKKKTIPNRVRIIMGNAKQMGLFSYSYSRYTAELRCLIAIYPELEPYKTLWQEIRKRPKDNWIYYSSLNSSTAESLSCCLYALLFAREQYSEYEKKFRMEAPRIVAASYALILADERYAKAWHLISESITKPIYGNILVEKLDHLCPLEELKAYFDRQEKLSDGTITFAEEQAFIRNIQRLWNGQWDDEPEACNYKNADIPFVKRALIDEASVDLVKFAETRIQARKKKTGSKVAFYTQPIDVYYYLLLLLQTESRVFTPIMNRVVQHESKYASSEFPFPDDFKTIIYDALDTNRSSTESYVKKVLQHIVGGNKPTMSRIFDVLIYYVVGKSFDNANYYSLIALCESAVQSGVFLLAYELAYVLNEWYHTEQTANLYEELQRRFSFTPMISRIRCKSEWEKTLSRLLAYGETKKEKATDEGENRIAYLFNPRYLTIQPVLQVKQAKGKGWSKGRVINHSTFYDCKIACMTEQDRRVAAQMGYSSFITKRTVFRELIGHPYIFLADTQQVPVEFVEAKPTILLKEVEAGYQLLADIENPQSRENIYIIKETNTRYKIYTLDEKQQEIINILYTDKLIVPKQGKDKLAELPSVFSSIGMNVQSDLAAQSPTVAVREVPADSRIRIQLLPYGDGLKAELFSKPFGTHPPYCKPGKGGKALIANDLEGQLQVKRDLQQEKENEQLLMDDIQALESLSMNDGLMSFGDPLDSLQILDIALHHTEQCVVEWPEGERLRLRGTVGTDNLRIRIKSGIDWFDLSGELRVSENTVITLQQLLALTAKGHRRFIELQVGEYMALSAGLKKQLDAIRLFSTETKGHTRLNKFASAALDEMFDEMNELKELEADRSWKEFHRALGHSQQTVAAIPPALQAELRPYQEDGFRWMTRLATWNAGACLADEMGLGKTLQTLALLLHRIECGAALVVCPVSVVGNWIAEAERFAPSLRMHVLSVAGSGRRETLQALRAGDVLVTSYGLLQSEDQLFAEFEFATIVLDEAHVIKNYATKTSKATMNLKGAFRIALTGTPVQNHLSEIWNLFNFINPGLLGSLKHFNDTFMKDPDEQTRKYLKKLIAPFILRRTKTHVIEELPPKTEIVKRITLSDEEMAFYEALRRQALENLSGEEGAGNGAKHIQVLAEITRLRQACCNPALINPDIRIASTKLNTFLDLVSELRENNHRALVFSQFVAHLTRVREALDAQHIDYQYIDGSVVAGERQKRVDAFQNGKGDLFLISLKAGGLGLNLTTADYVIHLDPWWNPAAEDQASDRAHRIGQKRPVTIYRLVAENTIEEKIIQLHHQKRDMAESLLEGSDRAAKLSLEEIMELLKEEK